MARFLHGFGPRTGDNLPPGGADQTVAQASQTPEQAARTVPPGKFGRLFPTLPPFIPSEKSLQALADAMQDPETVTNPDPARDNVTVPAGYTYFGQFLDHDITFDTTSLQEVIVDPLAVKNFRSPALDLDNLYGSGPDAQPYLYQFTPGNDPQELFLIGTTQKVEKGKNGSQEEIPPLPNDLPRAQNRLGLLGDPRNDENLIVAQLHLAFLKFHNKVVEGIKKGNIKPDSSSGQTPFEQARDLVIWHYQWIVLHDFLRRVLDTEQLDIVLTKGRTFYKFNEDPFIPVEFSVAAYRLGHSMVRSVYDYNRIFGTDKNSPGHITEATLELLFEFTAKSSDGKVPVPIPSNWIIDWRRFVALDPKVKVNFSRKLDPFLVNPLRNLPNVPKPNALALRNLLRGRSLGLPSGQSVAKFMGFEPLTKAQISSGPDGAVAQAQGLDIETPLWYYILKEAQIQGEGKHLGKVGSRIVAEVFVGLLEFKGSNSFLVKKPNWKPTLPAKEPGKFTLADLLNFVGDLSPIDKITSV